MEKKELPENLAEPLLRWYDSGHRMLPWRTEPTPYRVWISEIMLQQTRVEAVKPYFARFMEALPNVESLANVEDGRLMKLWEGLGYYSRARNLKKAARAVAEEFNGILPDSVEALLRLPGIGSYTAGAISAFAYNKPEPAVDGNVLRVLARLRGDDTNVLDPKAKKSAEDALRRVIPEDRGGDFGQAMIELGATVCIPGVPACDRCPLRELCEAKRLGLTAVLPVREKKTQRRVEKKTVFVLLDNTRVAFRRRPDKGLLAGLYELPNTEGHLDRDAAIAYVSSLGLSAVKIEALPEAKHVFTHITWMMAGYRVYLAEWNEGTGLPDETLLFASRSEVRRTYAFPSAFEAYVREIPEGE